MKITTHNPNFKLVSTIIDLGSKYLELVYGVSNEGTDKGLEVYYYERGNDHFYRSCRWAENEIPTKYIEIAKSLSNHIKDCPNGYKLALRELSTFFSK